LERHIVEDVSSGAANNVITVYGGAIVDAGQGDDVIIAGLQTLFTRTDQPALLYGNAGNDRITGTFSDDWIIGGAGHDTLDGRFGSDRYYRFAGDGRDLIVDRGDPMPTERDSDRGVWDATEEQIIARLNADPVAIDTLVLPPGVSLADLTFSWTTRVLSVSVEDVELRTLDNYENIGPLSPLDVELPVLAIQWGNGEQVELAMPTRQMPKGFGVEQIEFADGTILSRNDLMALAPPTDLNTIDRDNVLTNVTRGYGGEGNDRLEGTDSGDELLGGRGNDVLVGGLGNDDLLGGKGADVLDGGAGDDWLGYSVSGGADEFYGDGNTYIGGTGDDRVYGTRDTDAYVFNLGDGRDTVRHEAPRFRPEPFADIGYLIEAGPGYVDYVLAEAPEDVRSIARSENSTIPVPLKGLDTLRFGAGIAPADIQVSRQGDSLIFAHVNGTDAVSFERWFSASAPVSPSAVLDRVEFADGTVWRVHADGSIEVVSTSTTLDGTDGDDALHAPGGAPSVMNGLGGNDLLVGAEGDDVIDGGTGNDTLYGNAGSDTLLGGDGDDALYGWEDDDTLQGGAGADRLFGDQGNDALDGGSGDDTLYGWTGNDALIGDDGDDGLHGDDGDDSLDGGAGSDALFGWTGNDVVRGGAGWDYMEGGDGNDVLVGGTEGDTLIGAAGDDVIAGGTGDDVIALGAGSDTVIFNLGDGRDTVQAASIGGGSGEIGDRLALGAIPGDSIRLAREGNDLVLRIAGTEDAIRFAEWYASSQNQTVGTLLLNAAAPFDAENFADAGSLAVDFRRIVDAFDAAYASDPAIGDWAVPPALLLPPSAPPGGGMPPIEPLGASMDGAAVESSALQVMVPETGRTAFIPTEGDLRVGDPTALGASIVGGRSIWWRLWDRLSLLNTSFQLAGERAKRATPWLEPNDLSIQTGVVSRSGGLAEASLPDTQYRSAASKLPGSVFGDGVTGAPLLTRSLIDQALASRNATGSATASTGGVVRAAPVERSVVAGQSAPALGDAALDFTAVVSFARGEKEGLFRRWQQIEQAFADTGEVEATPLLGGEHAVLPGGASASDPPEALAAICGPRHGVEVLRRSAMV
jgi:Ca2+-binding RTX toxin-like protein